MIVPKKILAVKLRALGDTVLMTAPLLELRSAYPNAEIHVVVTKNWESLLRNHPAVDKIWFYERHKEATSRAKNIAKLALRLRKEKFDVAVNFHASPSSSALCYAVGAKTRSIHFHGHKDKNRYSNVIIPGKGILKPAIERDMDTIRALDLQIPEGKLPKIFLTEEEITQARRRLQQLDLKGPILCIGIGASRDTKMWPLDRFASIAVRWVDQTKGSVIVLNGKDETHLSQKFFSHVDDKVVRWYSDPKRRSEVRESIQNKTEIELRLMSAIFSLSRAYLGNDSGPKHIAVASGLPTLTLFGPEDPFEWHPYPKESHPYVFLEELKCRNDHQPGMKPWCGLHHCKVEEHRCMKQMSEDRVYRALTELVPELNP
jgi:ADP-heptose:LPS heptosyltransferase